jgi:S-adenosylmethionine decarboxylase
MSNSVPEKIPESPGFEGPEKVLEIDMVPGSGPIRGLRDIPRSSWDLVCTAANCTILNSMSNDTLDSYVLSESSLFVYPLKIIMKTCGTTTLLRALGPFLEITKELGMSIEWMAYTRKNFIFPHVQKFPHRDPQEETSYLREYFPEGSAFLMGPLTGDHWLVYVADYVDRPTSECVDRTLDMMMFGIDESVAKLFTKDSIRFPKDSDVTNAAGIDMLLPGSTIQEFCFEPCGYSMNGLLRDAYWTIHITPESHCSYASFETNVRMRDYQRLVRAVLAIFRPKRFTMTLFADEHGLQQMSRMPFDQLLPVTLPSKESARLELPPCQVDQDGNTVYPSDLPQVVAKPGTISYVQSHKSSSEFMGYGCQMANFTLVAAARLQDVPEAATQSISIPRARYIISDRLEELKSSTKIRSLSESL